MQELRAQLAESEAARQQLAGERQAWEAQRGELQSELAAAKKAQGLAQGRLVLAKQREGQLKVRSQQSGQLVGALVQMGGGKAALFCLAVQTISSSAIWAGHLFADQRWHVRKGNVAAQLAGCWLVGKVC